jgi:phage protein U
MIGTLGRKIIFEVSDNRVLTFESMSREVSGRWTEHEVLGVKPKAEFLGPGLQTISLTIHLSAALGVKPRRILDMVERMVERGTAEYLVIGGRLVGRRPFRVTDRVKPGTRFTAAENWPRLP